MKCPKCGHVFEVEDENIKLTKKVLSLLAQGKEKELKKIFPMQKLNKGIKIVAKHRKKRVNYKKELLKCPKCKKPLFYDTQEDAEKSSKDKKLYNKVCRCEPTKEELERIKQKER